MVGPATNPIKVLGADCKQGGSFYVCDQKDVKFVGCCDLDPCKTSDGLCPDKNLRNSTFDKYSYNSIAAQDCVSTDPSVQWWACAAIDVPFMGCCSDNPCKLNGCPADKLYAARLSDKRENQKNFLPEGADAGNGLSTGAKVGIAIGVIAGVALIAALLWFWKRRRDNNNDGGGRYSSTAMGLMGPSQLASSYDGRSHHLGSPSYQKVVSPHLSPYQPSEQYDPVQNYLASPSPPMSTMQDQWRTTLYSEGGRTHQSYGQAPSELSSGERGHLGAWYQQQPAQELATQHHIVELPGNTISPSRVNRERDGDGDGNTGLGLKLQP
ncbi:unnamed protein product [Clonostachys rosea f. rosea IK726]|jgi:hypothetical protein|uniref:Uncharacterized protein n=1 Tax=Clonostachys rosea f. rosea IK726 TaxID=1349383 RepID=A0ACA9TY24_BIOOC|nr:unnamed protein product [Clonostachys rosea f. rosea IK726]